MFPEKAMETHSSTLAWNIPQMEEPGRLQSIVSLRVRMTERPHFHALEKEMAAHSSVLAWRVPGTGEPGGPPSVGLHWVGLNWSDLAAAAAAAVSVSVVSRVGWEGLIKINLCWHVLYIIKQSSYICQEDNNKTISCSQLLILFIVYIHPWE